MDQYEMVRTALLKLRRIPMREDGMCLSASVGINE